MHCWILSNFFHSDCCITDGTYKGVGGGGEGGVGGGWEAEGRLRLPLRDS